MKKYHKIEKLHFERGHLILSIDGEMKRFQLKDISPTLTKASEEEKLNFELSPSGYGIHWPMLDEDISIDGLLGITHKPQKSSTAKK